METLGFGKVQTPVNQYFRNKKTKCVFLWEGEPRSEGTAFKLPTARDCSDCTAGRKVTPRLELKMLVPDATQTRRILSSSAT